MHDALPPPLDRQGIGRFWCRQCRSAADMLLNDGADHRLRGDPGDFVRYRTPRTRPKVPTGRAIRLRPRDAHRERRGAQVDLYEYQGRELFARHGLPVLGGGVATTPAEARAIAERLGGRVVVKAQVKVGGRGKAGGVKLAGDADEAEARAGDILGMDIKGHTVHKVMLTTTADIVEEYYFSYLLDRANRTFLAIASVAGGMDIEQVAVEDPDKVAKVAID